LLKNKFKERKMSILKNAVDSIKIGMEDYELG